MEKKSELFRSRFGLIAALLGTAVGTGNIWRFPRVMAENGGGAFFIPWLLFLFIWSIPILVVEFACGQKLKKSVVGCFNQLSDGKLTWIGGFIVCCTLGIMFYYSVVTGWCLYYLTHSMTGSLFQTEAKVFWDTFSTSGLTPLGFHIVAILLTAWVIAKGVHGGIERLSEFMIPALFIILALLAGFALSLPGKNQGLEFIFNTDFSKLKDYKVWLAALSQSAWSTGAGAGLVLTYSCYSRSQDDPVLTPFTTGLGNNAVSLIAVFAIIPTLFSFFPLPEVMELTESGNIGLTFIALPNLFQQMPGGRWFAIFFFTALFFAAFTSLVSMFELGISFLRDIGISRKKGVIIIALVAILIGAPSALNFSFLDNQDWVWGVGLLVSGFFFTVLVRKVGIEHLIGEFVPLHSRVNRFFFKTMLLWIIPLEFFALLIWWFTQSVRWDPTGWWNPFQGMTIGTCLFQWGIVLFILFLLNKKLSQWVSRERAE